MRRAHWGRTNHLRSCQRGRRLLGTQRSALVSRDPLALLIVKNKKKRVWEN